MGFQEDHVCLKHNLLPISVSKYTALGQRPEFFFLFKIVVRFFFFSLDMCGFETNSCFSFAEILHTAC